MERATTSRPTIAMYRALSRAVVFRRTNIGFLGIADTESCPLKLPATAFTLGNLYAVSFSRQQTMVLFQVSGNSATNVFGGRGSSQIRFQALSSENGLVPVTIS